MNQLQVGLGERSYPIFIEGGCLKKVGADLADRKIGVKYCIISDSNVASLYGEELLALLRSLGIPAEMLVFPAGEQSKNLETFTELSRKLAQMKFDRKDCIIALGGGVTGDLAGFVASSYMRGISFVQIPTTLLSQVDSSVGGKTGVDIPEGKNLVGAFYQPKVVYIDSEVLRTLPREELLGGMAEVIKYGVIHDKAFFSYLKQVKDEALQLEPSVIEKIIHTSCAIKADVVAKDERESDYRRILNYGHTIGHAVESVSNFTIIHGMAVAMGMVAVAKIGCRSGLLSQADLVAIEDLIKGYGLPTEIPENLDRDMIQKYLLTDKKVESGKVVYVIPVKIGEVTITSDVSAEIVQDAI